MAKQGKKPELSGAQLEIMELVWERGEVTVAELWQVIGERRGVARNTVQTTVARLEERGWLRHRDEGGTFRYRAARPRQAAVRGLARRLLDTAFQGSISGLVMALLDGQTLSSEEADRLRALIDQADRKEGS